MLKLSDLKYPIEHLPFEKNRLIKLAAKKLRINESDIIELDIIRKSLDARKKQDIHYSLSVSVTVKNEEKILLRDKVRHYSPVGVPEFPKSRLQKRPVIAGLGPCGLFCALVLAKSGANPIVLERGEDVDSRRQSVNRFWEDGILNPGSNVQFGEGGAGAFSDGKLTTGTKSVFNRFILETFVRHGAPEDILIDAKPHIGTDRLAPVIKSIRQEIELLGGTVIFGAMLNRIYDRAGYINGIGYLDNGKESDIETDNVVLAVGHSARDTYEMLFGSGVVMRQKAFSVGLRIEHLQSEIDRSMYGEVTGLPPSAYQLSEKIDGRGVYSFCMCPGGYVIQSASEANSVVTNGMSYNDRSGKNANSALLVSVNTSDLPSGHVLAGVEFQRRIEKAAFISAGSSYRAPVCSVGEFLEKRLGKCGVADVMPSIKPGFTPVLPDDYLPEFVVNALRVALPAFNRKIRGFSCGGAALTGPETRSSAPVQILRSVDGQATNLKGLYPAGEGAGYAGGIMSAAADGINTAVRMLNVKNT